MFKPSDLAHFYGSENMFFNPLFKAINYTDGIKFLGANGASWLVTDTLAAIIGQSLLVKADGFLSIKCEVKNGSAVVKITDGDDGVLHRQEYPFTDLPCSIAMYCEQGYPKPVLMLTSER